MYYGGGWGLLGMLVMTVGMVLFWVLVVVAIIALVRYLQRTGRADSGSTRAEEVLAERFARGEIDEEEYRRRLETLTERRRRA
ncbi:putative membrane protein [Saccharopolyspora antimicrobica]|uniref:Membrane protein n=1 Tax=Saccharopolyspora antimicrobica TaxID=455193 RepID=A0A1I4VQN3_9PSEU|nr:SHOCT domain-containing protein [Saccharopolyspora antimicrobica]RKT87267.1 putative membrane protein [Saccharopolyspora antimicrobica]SFN03329.1 putative membrane protein [Saccharopolyspora antimicrobica]